MQTDLKKKTQKTSRSTCRHLMALSRKNYINWRRTIFGSAAEIICPILLMLILVWARTQVDPEDPIDFDIYELKKPFYPTAQLNLQTNEWQDANINATRQGVELIPFMQNSDYSAVVEFFGQDLYEPLLDPLGPYYFFPPHCITDDYQVASPYIAYIDNGNQITRDMVTQLEMLQQKQKTLSQLVGEFLEAVRNPIDVNSFDTFLKLFEGGTQAEQREVLAQFGVPQSILILLQVSDALSAAESPESPIDQQIVAATIELLQEALMIQAQLTEQVDQVAVSLVELSVADGVSFIGLSEEQAVEFLELVQIFLGQPPLERNTTQIGQELELNATQQEQLAQILSDLNQALDEVSFNATALNSLLAGEITLTQFQNLTQSNVRSVAESLGLTEAQVNQTDALAQIMNSIQVFEMIFIAGDDPVAIQDIALDFGITQQQLDLLEYARNQTQLFSPQLTGVVLNLTQEQQDLLIEAIQTDSQFQAGIQVIRLSQSFNLTDEQLQLIAQNLTGVIDDTISQESLIVALFTALTADAPTETQIFADAFLDRIVVDQVAAADLIGNITNAVQEATSIEAVATALGVDEQSVSIITAAIDLATGNTTEGLQNGIELNETALRLVRKITRQAEFGAFELRPFESKDELWAYIQHPEYELNKDRQGICFGFHIIENSQNDYELDLYFNDLFPTNIRSLPSQRQAPTDPTEELPQLRDYGLYTIGGFSFMQNWVANTILKRRTKVQDAQIAAIISPMRPAPVIIDYFVQLLQLCLSFFVLLMYIPVLYRMVYRVVYEKTNRVKESLRMVGMTDLPYWTSWLLYYSATNTLLVVLVWSILMINVFSRNSALALFLILWLYGQALFGIVLIAQSVFTSPRAAAITSTVFYFGLATLQSLIDEEDEQRGPKLMLSFFFPQIAMIQTFISFVEVDASLGGVTSQTVGIQHRFFSVQDGLTSLVWSGLMMFVVGAYLEAVMPKTYGQRRHPLFFLGYPWRCKRDKRNLIFDSRNSNEIRSANKYSFETKYMRAENFEPAPAEFQNQEKTGQILQISDLRKKYPTGLKAVDGLNLKMYNGQIFVLLGHNGAGKTTTIGLLTGLLQRSQGEAKAFGIDVFNDMSEVRKFMGVCPQHDVLFEFLTTEEHLSLFYDLKGGVPNKKAKAMEIEKIMKDVGIYDKRNALAQHLSGGNKRKLSVAIALIGGSKFVLLDEPSSGLDLQARRQLWNMLKEYKKDRIVILTTHYMDEADILGDRIGIMAKGKMTCLGSSMFLKEKFGFGYNMSVVKKSSEINKNLMVFLHDRLGPEVRLLSEVATDLKIQIPQDYAPKFATFFEEFDCCADDLGVQSYGLSISTLEEVFLRIGHLENPHEIDKYNTYAELKQGTVRDQNDQSVMALKPQKNWQSTDFTVSTKIIPSDQPFNMKDNRHELDNSFCNHLTAILAKRVWIYKRNRKAVFNEVGLPALIMFFGFWLSTDTDSNQSESRIQSPSRLPFPQNLLVNNETVANAGIDIRLLTQYLPNGTNDKPFDITFDSSENQTFLHFGDQVYDFGRAESPTPPNYLYGSYQIYEANLHTQQYKFVSFINTTAQDVAGLYPQFMYEAILKTATQDPDFKFVLRSSPYPLTKAVESRIETFNSGVVIFITAIGYSVLLVGVVSYLVLERTSGLKHIQEVSNLQLKAFWVGNFIIDFLKLQLTIIVTVICFFMMEMNLPNAWVTYLLFPFSAIPFTYVTTFIFTSDSAAQTFTMFWHFLVLAILSFIVFILRLAPPQQRNGDIINQSFKGVATYMLASSVQCDASCELLADFRERQPTGTGTGGSLSKNPWHISNNLGDLAAIAGHFCIWWTVIFLIEISVFRRLCWCKCCRPRNKTVIADLDDDVVKEAEKVRDQVEQGSTESVIMVKEFKKVYRIQNKKCFGFENLTAVNNLSFSVERGECFCLLGVNGAGKSTTFKSLTKQVEPSSGSILIGGIDIARHFDEAKRIIGYCPQPNLIFEYMSVEEHLWYYARIKGIPKQRSKRLIEDAIQQLGLQDQRKKAAGTLSGGNKRKLCVAMAILGNPPIILLDEPSAGMDPEARRFMWSFIEKISQNKSSAVVLTTHSMEEAEALSTKMGIMVKGGIFKCFGSAQHIKNKFGTGYIIELKLREPEDSELWGLASLYYTDTKLDLEGTTSFDSAIITKIERRLKSLHHIDLWRELNQQVKLHNCIDDLCDHFGEVEVLEQYGAYLCLRVQKATKSIGQMFALMAQMKRVHGVVSYSVGQTTLEQVFQSFADQSFAENITTYHKKVISPDGPAEQSTRFCLNKLSIK